MSSKSPYTFIDTSIFMEVFKKDSFKGDQLLAKATSNHRRSAAHWSIIEINKYFLIIAIKLHNKVIELRSAPDAKAVLSNSFGREANYHGIIDSLMMRSTSAAYHNDYRVYASQLENIIVDIQDRVHHMVAKFEGTFGSHPIAKSFLYSSEDFESHMKIVAANKDFDFDIAWKKYHKELVAAQDYFSKLANEKGGKLNQMERDVKTLIDCILDESAPPNDSKRHIGDLIVALSCPKEEELIAHDRSFNTISPSLGKTNTYVDFDKL